MGKGIPDIMTGADYNDVHLSNERAGGAFSASCTGSAKSGLQARQGGHSRHKTASTGKGFVLDEGKGVDAKKSEEDDEKRDDETDTGLRVRVLDYARRQMADAGNAATVARADSEIAHNASPGCRRWEYTNAICAMPLKGIHDVSNDQRIEGCVKRFLDICATGLAVRNGR